MKHGILHLFIFICLSACFCSCRSHRSVTRETVTSSTGEEKQTTINGVTGVTRTDSVDERHVLQIYREDSMYVRINYDSCGRIKEIGFSNRKTENALENIKANPIGIIRKLPAGMKQPLPVHPTLSNKARKKKRLQTGVAYGRS